MIHTTTQEKDGVKLASQAWNQDRKRKRTGRIRKKAARIELSK